MKEETFKDPAFPLYAQDFLTGVVYLPNDEVGVYIKILCKQWTDFCVPKKGLIFLTGKSWEDFSEELREKFTEKDGKIYNERLEKERTRRRRFKKIQSQNGSLGGRPKKTQSKPKKNPNETQLKPNQNPIKTQSKPKKKPVENENEYENEYEIESKSEYEIETENCFKNCLKYFPDYLHPNEKNKPKWIKTIDQLNRIDKIPFETIEQIVKRTRADSFWSKKFLSIPKLRTNNPEGIKYIVVFNEQFKTNDTTKKEISNEHRSSVAKRLGII